MRLLIQRVTQAAVTVDDNVVGSIGPGALVLLGIHIDDTPASITYLSQKLIHLRMFHDADEKMNLSLLDTQGAVLIVSQFTLYANCQSGRRPDFIRPPAETRPLRAGFWSLDKLTP